MRIILLFLLFNTVLSLHAQEFKLRSDHYAILVNDLDRSVAFYHDLLGIEEIANGTGKENIRWFQLVNGLELHLIEKANEHIKLTKDVHLSLATDELDKVIDHFKANRITFETWLGKRNEDNIRPDGIRQIYLQDPDGYWIEINDAK